MMSEVAVAPIGAGGGQRQGQEKEGTLMLNDGTRVRGVSFGAERPMSGEVVFNTSMVGYPEALTDPSYRGQILILTYVLVGNYGVPAEDDMDELGLPRHFESSSGIQVAGLIVSEYSREHSHWTAASSLGQWLERHGVPALCGVDTRALTKRIREQGALLGRIEFGGAAADGVAEFEDPNLRNLVAEVSCRQISTYGAPENSPHILAFDCGMKHNIIRFLVRHHNVRLTVVPYDYPLEENPQGIDYQGIFISNGPGDPTMAAATITSIQWAMRQEPCVPIFGICLGNQILARAAGAETYHMKFGNRGMNQPVIDLRTGSCYITPQNHGFAVRTDSLPPDWKPFFLNANDGSNEGVIHASKPFFAVQFHPEACGGPTDTSWLFDMFVSRVAGHPQELTLLSPAIYEQSTIKKVLLVGSGGLSIGQAGEFDYSGSQAIKALKEEKLEVVLVNPNIATVQTSKHLGNASADTVYFLPIRAEVITEIIEKERPDGIVVSMGGQTALNVGIELHNSGILERYGVKVLGTPISTIVATEDRELFSEKLHEIGETLALSYPATNVEEAKEAARKIGYPVLVRAAFALGGLGSGFADNEEELAQLVDKAFAFSGQVLIDQDLRGWKELEYEVVRDVRNNCITVCNMENFDPLGVHTGDSIVVAPSQTLSNEEYFRLRATAIKVVRHLGVVGECNIQYAVDPTSTRYTIIEVNARLSRSSALASKATGYPLAYVAAKLALNIDLVSIRNSVTKTTTACFEPSLDYCVVKMPRWDLKKFNRVSTKLGSSMTSVGEVMAIGRSFEEAIQQAVRMVNPALDGLDGLEGDDQVPDDLEHLLRVPTDQRLFAVQAALDSGRSVQYVHDLTKIDPWFLSKLANIANLRRETRSMNVDQLHPRQVRALKCAGFSDRQIARYTHSSEQVVRRRRLNAGIRPFVKQIDTLAAEFPAETNYLYMTYNASEDDLAPCAQQFRSTGGGTSAKSSSGSGGGGGGDNSNSGIVVLGSGAYCIGSSVEFDWCAVSCVRQLRAMHLPTVVVNCNPETVSTDYDESDRLYFEELSMERVLDIYEWEHAAGVIVSVGGQIPNNLARPLHDQGVRILGTSPTDIDRAEDRHQFSALLDRIRVDQPAWKELTTVDEAQQFAAEVGFPVLVRPSFVLSGAAMNVAMHPEQLTAYLGDAAEVSQDKPVVLSKFVEGAKEIEFDGVAANGEILNYAISEHVENAGVHSGDATLVLPAQKLYVQTIRRVKRIASTIARELNISGPVNIQLLAKANEVKVIECNLRASRTFPFISKVFDANFISLATRIMLGAPAKPYNISLIDLDYVAVKAPMFSFTRLRGADPTLGVEMSSTGEVACFGSDVHEAFLQALLSTSFSLPPPPPEGAIFISIASEPQRHEFLASVLSFHQMGYTLYGTPGTAAYFNAMAAAAAAVTANPSGAGADPIMHVLAKPESDSNIGRASPAPIAATIAGPVPTDTPVVGEVLEFVQSGRIHLGIIVPDGSRSRDEITAGYLMRRAFVDYGVSLLTNVKCGTLLAEAMAKYTARGVPLPTRSCEEFHSMDTIGWSRERISSTAF